MKTPVVDNPDSQAATQHAETIHRYIRRFAFWQRLPQPFRMIVATVMGVVLILLGIIMLFTPGQGVLTILAGIAVLGTEFHWAKHCVGWCCKQGVSLWKRGQAWWRGKSDPAKASLLSDEKKQD